MNQILPLNTVTCFYRCQRFSTRLPPRVITENTALMAASTPYWAAAAAYLVDARRRRTNWGIL
jgi:hypothetical protein